MPLERNLRPTRRQACAAPLTENEVPEQILIYPRDRDAAQGTSSLFSFERGRRKGSAQEPSKN